MPWSEDRVGSTGIGGYVSDEQGKRLILESAKKTAGALALHGAGKSNSHLLRWLMSLGAVGLFAVAFVDSSLIPLPLPGSTDLVLLLLTAHRNATLASSIWLGFSAFAGSMLGGWLTWSAGQKGGKAALEKYVPRQMLSRITGWVERHGAWTVGVAALLPPPVPLMPFIVAAGALGVVRGRFLAFYGAARFLRYGLLTWLGMTYGRKIVKVWQIELAGWGAVILWVYGGLVALGIAYGVWKYRRGRASGQPTSGQPTPSASEAA